MKNKIRFSKCSLLPIALLALFAWPGVASAVELLVDERTVHRYYSDADSGSEDERFPVTPFGHFATDSGGFSQDSMITENMFSGSGNSSAQILFTFYDYGYSVFDVTFQVATATLLDLEGFLGVDYNLNAGENNGHAAVKLYDRTGSYQELMFSDDGYGFQFSQILNPGTYRIVLGIEWDFGVLADYNEYASVSWDFSANFTPVPIPAVGWSIGLLLLALYRRR